MGTDPVQTTERSRAVVEGPKAGYGAVAKTLHWSVAVLVAAQFAVTFLMPDIGPGAQPSTLTGLHFSLGALVCFTMAVRLAHRLIEPVPPATGDSPAWERRAAQATHAGFYLLLIGGPFLGWASASAHDLAVDVFGLLPLPRIAAHRAHWALTAGDVHALAMWTVLGAVAFHATAALWHHWHRHDGVLQRMLP